MKRRAVILAAGGSQRMGRPKALLELDGRPIVAWHCERLATVADEVVVADRRRLPRERGPDLGSDRAQRGLVDHGAASLAPPRDRRSRSRSGDHRDAGGRSTGSS
jgi:CTP:molybdopterin cytidylyltransferase MocA